MSAELCQKLRAVEYGIPLGTGTFYRPNPLTQKAAETIEKQAATIAELEKRIGELEAERDSLLDGLGELNGWLNPRAKLDAIVAAGLEANDALDAAEQALTAERQRREACEAVLGRYTGTDLPNSGPASDYFSTTEAENE